MYQESSKIIFISLIMIGNCRKTCHFSEIEQFEVGGLGRQRGFTRPPNH